MNDIEKLLNEFPDDSSRRELKFINLTYKSLVNDDNKEQLDDIVNSFVDLILELKKTPSSISVERKFDDYLMRDFYEFLLKEGKTETTAYDYCKRIDRICGKNGIEPLLLYTPVKENGPLLADQLIYYYTENEEGRKENAKVHNSYGASLKRFKEYMVERFDYIVARDEDDGSMILIATRQGNSEDGEAEFVSAVEDEEDEAKTNGKWRTIRLFDTKGRQLKFESR